MQEEEHEFLSRQPQFSAPASGIHEEEHELLSPVAAGVALHGHSASTMDGVTTIPPTAGSVVDPANVWTEKGFPRAGGGIEGERT